VAITQVGTATSDTDDGSTGACAPAKPTGVASGDVLIATISQNENTLTVPSGFTLIQQRTTTDTTNTFSGHMYYKVCGGSEPSTYSFSKAADGGPLVVTLSAWRGVDTAAPINTSSSVAGAGIAEPANPTISVTSTATSRVLFARCTRNVSGVSGTSELPTYSSATGGWSEISDAAAFSGGTVNYGNCVYAQTADSAAAAYTEPAVTCSRTETDNVYIMVALKVLVATSAPAEGVSATATAYDAGTIVTTNSAAASAVATAYNATVLTGVAAENTGFGAATVTAYNATGWVIHPVNVGVQAFDATVAIGTEAGYAQASVAVNGAVAYFGAPASRVWKIPPEDRTWPIPPEDRTYNIVAENRAWQIPPKD
jgi:hypothetical protein